MNELARWWTVAEEGAKDDSSIKAKTKLGKRKEFRIHPVTDSSADDYARHGDALLPAGHGETILVVEDEEAVLELTRETLENYGYQVVTAQNGVQGIARFEEAGEKISLLLTDTDMIPMNGLEVMRAIRAWRPDLPVIIASRSKHDTGNLRMMETRHLTKLDTPYSLEELLLAVAKTIKA